MITLTKVEKRIDSSFQLGPITLELPRGNIIALVGNNGAGKSTLFQVMMGLVKYEKGNIKRIANENEMNWKREYAYVPQTAITYTGFTVKQVAQFFKIGYDGWDETEFERLITLFQIPINKRIDKLSVGIQKKAMIALALARYSTFLLLDEPLAGVDLEGQEQIKEEIVRYMERGEKQTILFATHSADEIKTLADYIMLLKEGQFEGLYEKDSIIDKWKRLWIQGEPYTIKDIDGIVLSKSQGNLIECVTENSKATEFALKENNIVIASSQQLELREILRYLLQKH